MRRWFCCLLLVLGPLAPATARAGAEVPAGFYADDRLFGPDSGAVPFALRLLVDGLPEAARAPLEAFLDDAAGPERTRALFLLGQVLLLLDQPAEAARRLAGVTVEQPAELRGWHAWLLGEARFRSGERLAAEADLSRAATLLPAGRFRRRAILRRVDCLLALGAPQRAARLLARTGVEVEPGFQRYVDGLAASARGDTAAAAQTLRRAAVLVVGTPLAGPVETLLAELLVRGETRAALNRTERLERVRRLLKDRQGAAAEAELDLLRDADPAAPVTYDLRFLAARALFVRKEYQAAAQAFATLATASSGQPEQAAVALRQRAKALAYADDLVAAADANAEVARRHPGTPVGREAFYYTGYLSLALGRWPEAARIFTKYLERKPRGQRLSNARWYRTWALIRAGARQDALDALDQVRQHGEYLERIGAKYWRAQLLAAAGAKAAEPAYRAVVGDPPWLYYGGLARARLREAGHVPPDLLPVPASGAPPGPLARLPRKVQARVDRAVLLARHGLLAAADETLRPLTESLAPNPGAALALGDLLRRLGAHRSAYLLALRAGRQARQAPPTAGTLALWQASYPRPWRGEVRAAAERHGCPEALLYAVMRQESAFDPLAVSRVGARGLLQLMPETGQNIATARGLEGFTPDWLFDPATNLDLAAWYLATLTRKFEGNLALAAASYNGGVPHVTRWLARYGGGPLDVFVEQIPFDETRGYTRKVLSSYAVYRRLYTDDAAPLIDLPQTVKGAYPGVVDF